VSVLSADWVVPVDGAPIRDGAVVIEGDRIAAVGPATELGRGERFAESVILPGLVNAHSHLEYAVYAGFGDGAAFVPWIGLHVGRKARLQVEEMEAIARVGAGESLRSGITTTGDASYCGAAATACAELGLRAIVYLEVFGRDTTQIAERFQANRERIAPSLSETVHVGISPHAPYTCGVELYEAAAAFGLPMSTHVAETLAEVDWVSSGAGTWETLQPLLAPPLGDRPARALVERGLIGSATVAAHCVHVTPDEIELLAAADVAVAHCPRSNGYLGCGVAPLRELLDAGVRVGLGSDSPASTPSFDMFDEMRAAVLAARARAGSAEALSAATVLELATLGSARALGLDAEVGSLAPGKQADLLVLSLADSPFLPVEDPVTAAVLGGSPERVAATLVAGEERYRKGQTEWRELTDAARSARSRMLR
jgi:5-methylthioadenosine/S-adenosylhomocysteine deaminase